MNSFSEVIAAFGGPAKFAGAIGITANNAGVMRARDSIPSEYWDATASAARTLGLDGISLELLAKLSAKRRLPATESVAPQAVNQ